MKMINIGVVKISDFDPSCGKMFAYDSYYNKNDDFYDESYDKDVKECRPKEVVLSPNQEHTLVIDYPTRKPYKAVIKTGKNGMTRIQLADKVCKHYRKMYTEEYTTTGGYPGHIPNMMNRMPSEGKYGIWGHDIGDLILCNVIVKKNGEIHVGVDS